MIKKHTVLIVDDNVINRSLLADMLSNEYNIEEAEDGLQAVELLNRCKDSISLILLDILMPKMDGFDVLKIMNKNNWIEDIPVIIISTETSSQYIDNAYNLGATDYINRPFDANVIIRRIKNTILLYSKQNVLKKLVVEQIAEKENNNSLMVDILSNIVEFRNGESGVHVLNIRLITEKLLKELASQENNYGITPEYVALVANASALHDIGKISIAEEILNKPGRLTSEEFEIIKTHSRIGADMISKVYQQHKDKLVEIAYQICRWHHERFDGAGYPDGLKGDMIPICAQVVSLADVYDALTSERVYKPPYTHDKAMEMIKNGECGSFNPRLLECLEAISYFLRNELVQDKQEENHLDSNSIAKELISRGIGNVSNRTMLLLEQERIKYRFFADMSNEIQFEYDNTTDQFILSQRSAKILGLDMYTGSLSEIISKQTIMTKEDYDDLKSRLNDVSYDDRTLSHSYLLRVNDKLCWYNITVMSMWTNEEKPQLTGFIGKLTDIHNQRVELEELKRQAEHDDLTNLYHHRPAKIIIERIINSDERNGALMIIDVDDFKFINDNMGHAAGDKVLTFIAEKISANIRSDDIAARIGGDEFIVFLKNVENRRHIERRVKHILREININYQGIKINISVGIALSPKDGRDYETLFNHADQALYTSKKNDKGSFTFYSEMLKEFKANLITPYDK